MIPCPPTWETRIGPHFVVSEPCEETTGNRTPSPSAGTGPQLSLSAHNAFALETGHLDITNNFGNSNFGDQVVNEKSYPHNLGTLIVFIFFLLSGCSLAQNDYPPIIPNNVNTEYEEKEVIVERAEQAWKLMILLKNALQDMSLIPTMEKFMEINSHVVKEIIIDTWWNAILQEKNFSEAVKKVLTILYETQYYAASNFVFRRITEDVTKLDREVYRGTIELYGSLAQMKELVEKPIGSYQSFSDTVTRVENDFTKWKAIARLEYRTQE